MQFYFIRHAQSANNALWDRTGASKGRSMDPGVTEIGQQQADLLARFLGQTHQGSTSQDGTDPQNRNGFGITHLYSSLMERAVYTASRIGDTLNLPVHACVDLHEEGGIYLEDETTGEPVGQPGNNRPYFTERYSRLVIPESLGEQGWWNQPYEAFELRTPRARRLMDDLLRKHGDTQDRVAVISHGGFYNHVMTVLLGLPSIGNPWFVMNNCAITRIDFSDVGMALVYQNRLDFMPRELVT
jgi:2,3-bisphosphoglycerate-dependent phosphoglycerate mutase